MIEYVVGPALAVLISLKVGKFAVDKQTKRTDELLVRIERLEQSIEVRDKEIAKKMLITLTPMAKAIKTVQETLGIQ